MYHFLKKPFKLEVLHLFLTTPLAKILDVGCGNHSPSLTKRYYPDCVYFGLDKNKNYCLDQGDWSVMEEFYEIDLQKPDFSKITDAYFDCIIMSHVIEHILNGEEVVSHLVKKLKRGGVFYLEFPRQESCHFPRMKSPFFGGTLNFYDDPTHVRIYERVNLEKILMNQGCEIVVSGRRFSYKRIIFWPIYFLGSLIELRRIDGGLFWDILGFADYVLVKKSR